MCDPVKCAPDTLMCGGVLFTGEMGMAGDEIVCLTGSVGGDRHCQGTCVPCSLISDDETYGDGARNQGE